LPLLFVLFVKTSGAVYTQSTHSLHAVYTQSTRSLHTVYTQSPLPVFSCERICLDQVFLWPRLFCCFFGHVCSVVSLATFALLFLWPRLLCCFFGHVRSVVSCSDLLNVELPHFTSSTRLHTVFYVLIFIVFLQLFRKWRPICIATGSLNFTSYHTENTFSPNFKDEHSSA